MRLMKLTVVLMALCTLPALADDADYQETLKIFRSSSETTRFFSDSYGYALFPTIGKAGMGIGGAFGKGQVYKGGVVMGQTSMTQASFGFQLGGQAYSEIIFFKDKKAYDEFTRGSFALSAQATAVAITASAQAQAGTTGSSAGAGASDESKQALGSYVNGMAVFVHAKGGLMYEASIGGQKFSFKPK